MNVKPKEIKAKNIADFIHEFEKKWDEIKHDLLAVVSKDDSNTQDDTKMVNIDDVFNQIWDDIGNLIHGNGSDVICEPQPNVDVVQPQPDPQSDPAPQPDTDPVDPNDPVYDPSIDDHTDGDGGHGDDDHKEDDDHKDHDKK